MCLLTVFPGGVWPDEEALLNGGVFNDDGHGFAIVAGDRLIVGKSLDIEEAVDGLMTARKEWPDSPAIFHSRMSTHGGNSTDNCHPFYVGGDERTVIAHNGILPRKVWPGKGDNRSDTRIAAEDFIPRMGALHRKGTRKVLQRWMTTANKMAILTVNPAFKEQLYILNEDQGIWDGGIWYSNTGYLASMFSYKSGSYSRYSHWWEQDYQEAVQHEIESGERCPDCEFRWVNCQCYDPTVPAGVTVIGDRSGNRYDPKTGRQYSNDAEATETWNRLLAEIDSE